MRFLALFLMTSSAALPAMARAAELRPIVDARLRYETVDQAGLRDAGALTARARLGIEAVEGSFSLLVESEATAALGGSYFSGVDGDAARPIVADPQNVELNRIQLRYAPAPGMAVTAGRQRINLDDQRFVGAVGWRQNEQTFDAVRIEYAVTADARIDLTYSWSDRTIWGVEGGRRGFANRPQAIGGNNLFANASYRTAIGTLTGFFYRIEADETPAALRRLSSDSYGMRVAGSRMLGKAIRLNYALGYARQRDNGVNPLDYRADYAMAEAGLDIRALRLAAGIERLGSDRTATVKATATPFAGGFAFQTPFATLHKFQGWADKFLTTPAQGVTDLQASAGYGWKGVGPFDALTATAVWHRFTSDVGGIVYGDEVDLQLQAKRGRYAVAVKYADYRRRGIASFPGDADTRKLWLQLEWIL